MNAILTSMLMTVEGLRSLVYEAIADVWTPEKLRQRRGFSPDVAKMLMTAHPKKMAELGLSEDDIENLPMVGEGTKGIAFDLGDKVLKFTDDAEEAASSAALMNVNDPIFAKYYSVFRFGQTPNFFGIVLEKLVPLEKSEADELDNLLQEVKFHAFLSLGNYDPDEMTKIYMEKVKDGVGRLELSERERREMIQRFFDKWAKVMRDFRIYRMMKALQKAGIQFGDYHAGNIMKRQSTGEPVIIDLGYSSGAKGQIETVNESYGA